jgi:hypothetical protein
MSCTVLISVLSFHASIHRSGTWKKKSSQHRVSSIGLNWTVLPETTPSPAKTSAPSTRILPVHILLWHANHIDRFWGPGHSTKMQILANKCSDACHYHLSFDQFRRNYPNQTLDVLLLYAGSPAKGENLWNEWLESKQEARRSVIWNTENDDDFETARRQSRHYRISYSFEPDIDTSQACDGLLAVQKMLLNRHTVDPRMKTKDIAAAISNCGSQFRQAFVKQLMTHMHVDHYGHCFHNVNESASRHKNDWQTTKQDLFKDYRFVLSLENKNRPGYITEKIFDALVARAIPIYWGTPDVYKYVPADKFIMVNASSPMDVATEIQRLKEDNKLYESFHDWDVQALNNTVDRLKCGKHPLCQLCDLMLESLRKGMPHAGIQEHVTT